jgi:hypothetical protein
MDHAQTERPTANEPAAPPSIAVAAGPALPRGLTVVAIAALLVLIGVQGRTLWNEWSNLQDERAGARSSAVIGYPGLQPRFSFAEKPREWLRRDGEHVLLWAGWNHGMGHTWFRVAPGDIDTDRMSLPMGRDVMRPIDHALVENGGGLIWGRVPDEALVASDRLGGVATAYPMLVLDKVAVINDLIGGTPFLVSYNPLARPEEQVTVYEPVVNGSRVTMGLSGYFHNSLPVLYDRGTESLWVHRDGTLQAVGGRHKGASLKQVARPKPVSFGRWKSQNPDGRLVIGADRAQPLPEL